MLGCQWNPNVWVLLCVCLSKDFFSWVLWNQYEKKKKNPHLSVAKDSPKIKMANPLLSKRSDTCEFAVWTWWQYKHWWMAGKKRASHNKLSENVSLSWCWEGPFHIYYSRLSTADISDFNAPCNCKSSANLSHKHLCRLPCDAFFPSVPPALTLLMCQNKPRPIRIKALKRSLMAFKVPLNWWADNMSSVEAAAEWGDWSSSLRFGALPSLHSHSPTSTLTLYKPLKSHIHIHTSTLFLSSHILSQSSVSICVFCAALLRTLAADDLAQCPCCIWTVIQN